MSLYIDMQMMRFLEFSRLPFELSDHFYRRVPWEKFPRDHDRFCSDVVEFSKLWRRDVIRNSLLLTIV